MRNKNTVISKCSEMLDAETLDEPRPFQNSGILTRKDNGQIDNLRGKTILVKRRSDLVGIAYFCGNPIR